MIYWDGFNHEDIDRGFLEGHTIYQILISVINRQVAFDLIQKWLTDFEHSEDHIYKFKQDHINRTIDLTIISKKTTEDVRAMFSNVPRIKLVGVHPCREPVPKLEYGLAYDWVMNAHKEMKPKGGVW